MRLADRRLVFRGTGLEASVEAFVDRRLVTGAFSASREPPISCEFDASVPAILCQALVLELATILTSSSASSLAAAAATTATTTSEVASDSAGSGDTGRNPKVVAAPVR
jgi:hypothetical protein